MINTSMSLYGAGYDMVIVEHGVPIAPCNVALLTQPRNLLHRLPYVQQGLAAGCRMHILRAVFML